jgi:DNA-binding NtrC family response regulator
MRVSSTLWIVHRDARQRAALARLAGAGDNTFMGGPSDELFASATPADVVLLAPSDDFESELEFVDRFAPQLPDCTWIVLPASGELAEAKRLFDNLPAAFLKFPPSPERLRSMIPKATGRRGVDSLSRRRGRKVLTARFARWFIDLDMPDLLHALDPRLAHLPLLIRGEVGTGRSIVARYVHAFSGDNQAELLHVPCRGLSSEAELIAFIEQPNGRRGHYLQTIWLEDADELPAPVQLRIRDWIEFGIPESVLRTTTVRFIVTARESVEEDALDDDEGFRSPPSLNVGLSNALSSLVISLPALRERTGATEAFVADTALNWSEALGERQRVFAPGAIRELNTYPWPGNMAQLKAVVLRSLSHTSASPLEAHHVRFHDESLPTPESSLPVATFVDPFPEPEVPEEELPELEPLPVTEPPLPEEMTLAQRTTAHQETLVESPDVAVSQVESEEADRPLAEPSPSSAPPLNLPATAESNEGSLRRLVGALAHEVRNPLVSIKTFSELLPEHHSDEDFRNRFAELVGNDVRQIESVVSRLQDLAILAPTRREPVDVASVIDDVLTEHGPLIQERHLLLLKELDRTAPYVLADKGQLERAIAGVLATAIKMVPERGDVYLASKHNSQGFTGQPTVRVLLRYHVPSLGRPLGDLLQDDDFHIEGITQSETSLDFLIAEAIVRAQGGAMTIDTTDAQETVIVIDLPAASS